MVTWSRQGNYSNGGLLVTGLVGFILGYLIKPSPTYIHPDIPNKIINNGYLSEENGKSYILLERIDGVEEVISSSDKKIFKNLVDITENQNSELTKRLQEKRLSESK